jgi:hypothetical protein
MGKMKKFSQKLRGTAKPKPFVLDDEGLGPCASVYLAAALNSFERSVVAGNGHSAASSRTCVATVPRTVVATIPRTVVVAVVVAMTHCHTTNGGINSHGNRDTCRSRVRNIASSGLVPRSD